MYSHDHTHNNTGSRRHGPFSRSITRSRSRSPFFQKDDDRKRSRSHRHRDRDYEDSRDKKRKSHHHHHRSHGHRDHGSSRKHEERPAEPQALPFGSRQLTKRDLAHYEPVLAMYLDIQKNLILEDLSEVEIKGRWKSFMGKWNRGELAEGWYDPSTLEKARSSHRATPPIRDRTRSPSRTEDPEPSTRDESRDLSMEQDNPEGDDDEEDDDYGPHLPQEVAQPSRRTQSQRSGPTIPKTEDLQMKRELAQSDYQSSKSSSLAFHKQALSSHKSELKHIQEEVAPRAEPGTHERRMEKRQERAAANRSFASARGGSPEGVGDDELMGDGGGGGGGGGDSLEAVKRERERETRKKNERELRREEILRARVAEREERMEAYRRKEDETMSVLKALAKQRFG
ncbi:hypothetical protein FQN54_008484 [Arachnomyces sp. PD_36]|nr:hypothetical protein FQN54_008484 [Arachnomyces sp. PD_36]